MKTLIFTLILALSFLAGCASPTLAPATPTPELPPAPPTGPVSRAPAFDVLVTELRAAGFSVEVGEAVNEPFFSVAGRGAKASGGRLEVFEYPNAAARQADSDKISPDGFQVGNSMVDWVDQPHFFAHGAALVLYVGRDAGLIDQLTTLYGAAITR
jgi:hypothetical protein